MNEREISTQYPWWVTAPLLSGLPFLLAWPLVSFMVSFAADAPSNGWRQQLTMYVILSCWAYPVYLLVAWLLVVFLRRRKVSRGYLLTASLFPYTSALPVVTIFLGVSSALYQAPSEAQLQIAVEAAASSTAYTFGDDDFVQLDNDGSDVLICADFLRGRTTSSGARAYRVPFVGSPIGDSSSVRATAVMLSSADIVNSISCSEQDSAAQALAHCDLKELRFPCVYRSGLMSIEVWTKELAMEIRAPQHVNVSPNQYAEEGD